jgi:DNA-directed RNA polymerase subunit RPC12/RpoP
MTFGSFTHQEIWRDVQSMSDYDEIDCISCGSVDCEVYYDLKYKGMRAKCNLCKSNWPES